MSFELEFGANKSNVIVTISSDFSTFQSFPDNDQGFNFQLIQQTSQFHQLIHFFQIPNLLEGSN